MPSNSSSILGALNKILECTDSMEAPLAAGTPTNWALPELSEEEINQNLKERFLTPSSQFSADWLNVLQDESFVDKTNFSRDLFSLPPTVSRTAVRFKRAGLSGQVVGYEEYSSKIDINELDSKNSLSFSRQAAPKTASIKGSAGFMPFAPGGIELSNNVAKNESLLEKDADGLFHIPPGFSRGLYLDTEISQQEADDLENMAKDNDEESSDSDIDEDEDEYDDIGELTIKPKEKDDKESNNDTEFNNIDDLLPMEVTVPRNLILAPTEAKKSKDWAHLVDVNRKMENFHELVPRMAREFPFELDTFQKEAVYHLEQGDSVFVAAHTSAGKTVVAEYAIAMAQRNMTKAIYTSPIKALSNQKFRDFKQIYDDVGILTGDVQINPEASCLIMTTEILRSMLYRGADVIRDVEFVIFDEVHYVNDQDRGVVWEEVIIMLPEHVKFILLSATVPNTFEFANWVGRTKQKNIYVISTPKRPVPLEHSLWVKGRPYKIVGAEKKFLLDGYNAAADALAPKVPKGRDDAVNSRGGKDSARGGARGGSRGGSANGRGGNSNNPRGGFRGGRSGGNYNSNRSGNAPSKQTFMEMINYLKKNNLLPVTIFVFSKKKCEQYAHYLNSLDFCTASDKNKIRVFIDKAVARLRKEDRDLPQIIQVREWLSRGIAVHHGGLLPIVKEVIEILFAESLIKVLFATETFAMGLNLPTRTVIFSGCRKHDGRSFRDLLPGEYTQMAGRAGRRGLDTTGTVYIMSDGTEPPTRTSLELMLLGNPTKLQSQFRLTYNMILNLLRVEALKVEDMIKRSFSENSAQLLLPEHQKSVQINETLLAGMVRKSCDSCDPDIDETHDNIVKYQKLVSEELEIAFKSSAGRKSLSPGRVIIFQETSCPRDIAITINSDLKTRTFKVLVLSNYSHKTKKRSSDNTPYLPFIESYAKNNLPPFKLKNEFKIKTISFDCVEMVTKHIMDRALIQGIIGRDPDIIKAGITWINDIAQKKMVSARLDKIKEVGFLQAHEEKLNTMEKLRDSKSARSKSFLAAYKEVHEEYLIKCKIESLKSMISDQNLELLPDYEQRIEVLQELNYVDPNLNVLLKGRVACEVNAGFELILTELILENFLGDYEPEEIVALLSCFVFDNGSDEPEFVTPRLDSGKARILGIVNRLNGIFNSHQILQTQEEIEFADRKRFGLMEVVYEWAKGLPFKSVIGLTDIQEGVVVRVITRLDEICREVKNAARIIGDTTLHDKMDEAQTKIKRDIVFCASLYL